MKKRAQYDARDAYNTISVDEGPNKGKSLRVKSGSKLSLTPGAKAAHQKAFSELPVFIARGTGEPKLTVDDMLERDSSTLREFIGGIGGYPFTWTTIFTRPGFPNRILSAVGCEVNGDSLGIELDENSGKGKLEALCMDILEDGQSIFAKREV